MKTPSRRLFLAGTTGLLLSGAGRAHRALAETLAGAAAHRPEQGPETLWLKRPDGSEIATRFRTDAGYDRQEV